jgi:calcineurin-like phosphoesterase family protein
MTIWFTSDTHFGHRNIIKYCDRPFNSIEEHDRKLIEYWNESVAPGDTVYHLGDFALCRQPEARAIANRLNGQIFLILGNHDKVIRGMEDCFVKVAHYHELKLKTDYRKIVLFHYAQRVWNASHHGSYHLFGHSHGGLPDYGLSTDVGVDRWGYCPVSLETIEAHMNQRKKYGLTRGDYDHHGEDR